MSGKLIYISEFRTALSCKYKNYSERGSNPNFRSNMKAEPSNLDRIEVFIMDSIHSLIEEDLPVATTR